jgi:hypothetical protein
MWETPPQAGDDARAIGVGVAATAGGLMVAAAISAWLGLLWPPSH